MHLSEIPDNIVNHILSFSDSHTITEFCSQTKKYKNYIASVSRLYIFPKHISYLPLDECHGFIRKIKHMMTKNWNREIEKFRNITISRESTNINGSITHLCISTNGLIVIASKDSYVSVWSNTSMCLLKKFKCKGYITSLCVLPNNNIAFATSKIYILDLNTQKCTKKYSNHNDSVTDMILYDDNIISVSEDRTSNIWNYKSNTLDLSTLDSSDFLIPPNTKFLCKLKNNIVCVIANSNKIYISGKLLKSKSGYISCICPFRQGFVCGYTSGFIDIYDLIEDDSTYGIVFSISRAHSSRLTCLVEYSSEILISCSFDNSIKLWRIKDTFKCIKTICIHSNIVRSIAIDPAKNLVSVGDDNKICITYLKEFI